MAARAITANVAPDWRAFTMEWMYASFARARARAERRTSEISFAWSAESCCDFRAISNLFVRKRAERAKTQTNWALAFVAYSHARRTTI
ncbi:hypothetical protein GCM10027079_18950 [Sediminivirga luteola]|uniref:Uncharacterized protein n=1 Tax=Sediminivirga luteola TaxID=1774748 RepID=A0A8J2TVY6_9MICO|nr:hypothetical protein GCM10011333_06420 [Sediminivirga luteola]